MLRAPPTCSLGSRPEMSRRGDRPRAAASSEPAAPSPGRSRRCPGSSHRPTTASSTTPTPTVSGARPAPARRSSFAKLHPVPRFCSGGRRPTREPLTPCPPHQPADQRPQHTMTPTATDQTSNASPADEVPPSPSTASTRDQTCSCLQTGTATQDLPPVVHGNSQSPRSLDHSHAGPRTDLRRDRGPRQQARPARPAANPYKGRAP